MHHGIVHRASGIGQGAGRQAEVPARRIGLEIISQPAPQFRTLAYTLRR